MKEEATKLDFLSGGGEMGELIRNYDWSKTPLGPIELWKQSLRTTVGLVLSQRFPMLLWWSKHYICIYNDAYKPILGTKHPWALGLPVKEVWSEIWDVLQPLIDTPFKGGESTWIEDFDLVFKRKGFWEEAHFTVGYSPVPEESNPNRIGGVLATVYEISEKIMNERASDTLRLLGAVTFEQKSLDVIYHNISEILGKNNKDFPFALVYKIINDGETFTIASSTGVDKKQKVFPEKIEVTKPTNVTKEFCKTYNENKVVVSEIKSTKSKLPTGSWDISPTQFVHIPVSIAGASHPYCIISAALNPYRKFDDAYLQFCQLIGERVSLEINKMLALEEERKRAEALSELDKAKTVFFSNISHEFRTPLTLMLGPLEELLNKPENNFSSKELSSIETTHRNALRLLKLVNTLLDFSRIESGRQQGIFTIVDIGTLTKRLALNFQTLMDKAGVKFEINTNNISQPVYVDLQMWEKIIFNLLSNAFKYTLQGSIILNLYSEKNNVILEVKDTGVGIPEKELPHIFERFHRVQNSKGRTYEGTGIGLSLTKELVLLHGGKVDVHSKEGIGTSFKVTIPTGKDHLPLEKITGEDFELQEIFSNVYVEEAASLMESTLEKMDIKKAPKQKDDEKTETILIVDDNADMRKYLTALLENKYHVVTANNGKHALQKIKENKPTLVLTDLMMPIMDGEQLVHELKTNQTTLQTPVIILSARAGEESRIAGYDIGADDYLVKPFSSQELLSRIASQIRTKKIVSAAQQQLQSIFEVAPVTMKVLKGDDLKYVLANPACLKLFNRSEKELIGKPVLEVFPELKDQDIYKKVNQVYKTGKSLLMNEVPVMLDFNNDGSPLLRYLNYSAEPLSHPNGLVHSVIVLGVDVTEEVMARKKIEENEKELEKKVIQRTEELEEKNKELQQMNKELESFTYVSSHDLQEPLRKIQIFADLLLQTEHTNLTETGKNYFHRMQEASQRMQSLIQDLLAFSRINAGERDFKLSNLNEIVEALKLEFIEAIEEKEAIIDATELGKAKIIPFQFKQLMQNLISNSLKFTKPGTYPHIKIKSENISKGKSSVFGGQPACHISFTDNGIGFEKQFSEKIFQVFQRLHAREEYPGTGIGLAIVKKIVDNHNGHIVASSKLGKGTRFDIYFRS